MIREVLSNPHYHMNEAQKKTLKPHVATYETLLDKKIPLERKQALLKKSGHRFLPTFREIYKTQRSNHNTAKTQRSNHNTAYRVPKDCPVCNRKQLKRLANHLAQVHHLSARERYRVLRDVRHGINRDYDQRDQVSATRETGTSDGGDH